MVIDLNFDNKVRLRSKAELSAQNDGLILLKKILDKGGIKYYLSSGTLLGAVRDNDFIKWDWDVQMYLIKENAYPKRYEISKSLISSGFEQRKFNDTEDSLKWDLRKNGIKFELTAWYLEGKWRYRKNKDMRVPSYLFEGEYKINFKGVDYKTLNPPEEYLKFCYDDWKTPKRTSNKEMYSNSNHLRKYTIMNKFKFLIKKIIIKLKNIILKS